MVQERQPLDAGDAPSGTRGGASRRRPVTLGEFVLDELRRRIVLGDYPPGTRLTIDSLARDLDSSPMPVREAVHELEAEGLLDTAPHKGAVVAGFRRRDIEDAYEMLATMEVLVVERAAQAATAEQVSEMRHWLEEMRRLLGRPYGEEMLETHRAFHFALFDGAGEGVLLRHVRMLWHVCERYVFAAMPDNDRPARGQEEHERLVELVEQHDVNGIAEHLRMHLANSKAHVVHRLDELGSWTD